MRRNQNNYLVAPQSDSHRSLLQRWTAPLLLLAVVWLWLSSNQINPIDCDAVQYYVGATNLWSLGNPYAASATDLEISPTGWRYPYPPLLAYLWLPLSGLELSVAVRIWFLVNVLLTVVLAWQLVCILQLDARLAATVAFFAGLVIYPPQTIGMVLGQSHVLLAVTLVGSYLALRANYHVSAGLLLALAVGLKLFPTLFVVIFIAAGYRRAATSAIVAVCAWCALTFRQHWEFVDQFLLQPFYPHAAAFNVSIMGLTTRLFKNSDYAVPLVNGPRIGLAVYLVAVLAVCSVLVYLAVRYRRGLLIAATYPAMLLLAPVAGVYHCNLVPAAMAMVRGEHKGSSRKRNVWRGMFAALLLAGLPTEFGVARSTEGWRHSWHEWIHHGWGTLLMAPQTYGLILLLLMIGLYPGNESVEEGEQPS